MDSSADIALLGVVAFGDELSLRGPSCYKDSIPVGAGNRVLKIVGWWAESYEQW